MDDVKVKRFSIREIYALLILVLTTLFALIYGSMALFQKTWDQKEIAHIIIDDLRYSITSTDSSFKANVSYGYGTITVPAGTNKYFDVRITNDEAINTRYQMYYSFSGSKIIGVEAGVSHKYVGVYATYEEDRYYPETGIINSGSSKKIRIGIKNTSNQSVTLNIGVRGGYSSNYSVKLNSDEEAMEKISESFDTSGANEPVLASGMIPVRYSESCDNNKGCWVKADTDEEWYNYGKQTWANAVTVGSSASTCSGTSCQDTVTKRTRSYYQSAAAGTPISMDDINSMWVWIPRYKYRITSNRGSSSSVSTPPQIDVVFESGTNATGVSINTSGVANTQYYTHPAFRNGSSAYKSTAYDQGGWNEELTGFWAAKFEVGTEGDACSSSPSTTNCQNVTPKIKPNIKSLRYQNISTQFTTSLKFAGGTMSSNVVSFSGSSTYGLTSSTNTHMMKNTEWGAIAYLSQSKYGKMGNSSYTGTNKEIYLNPTSNMTGRSGGGPSGISGATSETSTGEDWQVLMHGYDGRRCTSQSGNVCTGSSSNKNLGYGASTTGTIYGIYDMSGGSEEYLMGNNNNTVGSSGFSSAWFTASGNQKYYDKYSSSTSLTATQTRSILGDATWETNLWYYDNATLVTSTYPWISRKGIPNYSYSGDTSVGIFSVGIPNNKGQYSSTASFRVSLIP